MPYFRTGIDDPGDGPASVGIDAVELPSALWRILVEQELVPGSAPSYEACKTIYAYHPMGRKMVEKPLEMAMSQEREISIPGAPEDDLISAFNKEWAKIGNLGADSTIFRIAVLSRIYGVGSLFVGTINEDTNEPLDVQNVHDQDLYFNMLDPLNTAGSLVLNQDPTAPDFLHPTEVTASGKKLHPSRCVVLINEQPLWIEWTDSAFGFIGRSVFQRAFFPLKSYVMSMVADNEIQKKLMLLIAKLETPGSVLDKRTQGFFGWKRSKVKEGNTGNVLSIGENEEIESLDLRNAKEPGEYSRTNIIKNIATSAGMPAVLLLEETLAEGFGEGSEDAKMVAQYIDRVRKELDPIYQFMDDLVMRRAWNPDFYEAMRRKYPDIYGDVPYETAFYRWKDSFTAKWPSFLQESKSEKQEGASKKVNEVVNVVEKMAPHLDPENKAKLMTWASDAISEENDFTEAPMEFDEETLAEYDPADEIVPPEPEQNRDDPGPGQESQPYDKVKRNSGSLLS